jgi:glycerol-3-phosphate acyltransferase PlsY
MDTNFKFPGLLYLEGDRFQIPCNDTEKSYSVCVKIFDVFRKIFRNAISSENSIRKAPEVLCSADLLYANIYADFRNGYSDANFITVMLTLIYLLVYCLLIYLLFIIYLFVISSATLGLHQKEA